MTDWSKANSVNALCGTAAAMGTLGVVHSDSADLAGSTCLTFAWTHTTTAMSCAFCTGKTDATTTKNHVWLSAY